MSCRKGFRGFDTSVGWRLGNGESYFRFVAFWPKRQNRIPAPPTSGSLRNVPSAPARCASSNVSHRDKFAIRQRPHFLSRSIPLSERSNTVPCMLVWACVAELRLNLKRRSFFHVCEEATPNNVPV